MAIDDRKQRILMAIVSLYAADGEPVGSNLLSRYFDMAVSSATLRNEMATLTRLGLLEQPHTSAGRVPTPKAYRFFVENLLEGKSELSEEEAAEIDAVFRSLDYDPDKLAQGAAKALADMLGYGVLVTTPHAENSHVVHFEVIQVGRYTAAVLAVTAEGGGRTRVAKVDYELTAKDIAAIAAALNKNLRFVAEADVTGALIRQMVDSLGEAGSKNWPVFSAALTLLSEAGRPNIYFEGQQYLLNWPELDGGLHSLLSLAADREGVERLLTPRGSGTTVLFGEEMDEPIPGLCLVSRPYRAAGGLSGAMAVAGPERMKYRDVILRLNYFSLLLGKGLSQSGAGL